MVSTMNRTTNHRSALGAQALLSAFRRVLARLMSRPWSDEFVDGLRMLAEQVAELEATRRDAPVDDELLMKLFPIVDSLERARDQARRTDPWSVRFFDPALNELVRVLRVFDSHPEKPLGHAFDPVVHEAVGIDETERVPPNRVVRILERGWYVGERQLRPSKVVVSKARAAA